MKWERKQVIGLIVMILVTAIAVGGIALWLRENKLEQLQNEALAELERNAGQYDEQSIVLHQTSKAKAEELAQMYGAELRITQNGRFATLTLPEGTTIRDVYAMEESRKYIDEMAADYQVQVSELTGEDSGQRLPTRPQYSVSDSDYELQTYLDYLNMGDVWSYYTGAGITVAVIDTGIDTDHPEFAGHISEYSYNATENKIVRDYNDWSLIEDEVGHGTAVTGVIAASMNGGNVVGIAPDVEILVIKAECNAMGQFERTSDLVFGIYYAIERDVHVINMSFGTYLPENPFAEATRLAYDSDIVCVAAAGNDNTSSLCWPAAGEYVIGVGALDGWELADYSNYGENANLCAPGTAYTTRMGGGYGNMTGTSLASPIVAGAIALIMEQDSYQTVDHSTEILYASCYDLGNLGRDWYYGFGALDVSALVLEERGKIKYDMLTGEVDNLEGLFIRGHTLQELPEPERLYAVFDGWYYDDTFTQEYNYYTDRFYGDVTLYAKWVNEEDGIPYTYVILDDGTVEIRSYTGHRRYLTIPEKIDGRVVSSIGDFAFDGQTRLREVSLPSGLTHIGMYAFRNCANLMHLSIPESVTQIEGYAFSGAVRLSAVAFLGDSKLHTVGDFAFADCAGLSRIELPASVQNINGSVFYGTTALNDIGVQQGNVFYQSLDGVLLDLRGTTVVAFPASWGSEYTLPEDVTCIGAYAFAFAKLRQIDLRNVSEIRDFAFSASNLESVQIPDSVIFMGKAVFFANESLCQVRMGRGLTNVAEETFAYCVSLKQITVPSNLQFIASGAFSFSGVESVRFEDNSSLSAIGFGAFSSTNIVEIDIPNSVVVIDDKAFMGTPLVRVGIAPESMLQSIGESAFAKCALLEDIALPSNLQIIGNLAFQSTALWEVTIPATVISIGDGAFSLCSNLTAITVAAGNTVYHDVDGVVYTLDNSNIHTYPAGKAGEDFTVDDATQIVAPWAFAGAVNLKWVDLPEYLTRLSEYSFAYCEQLNSINIPDHVVQIDSYCFAYDWNLFGIYFGEDSQMTRLSYGAFAYCGVYSFRVPAGVSTMARGVFEGCRNLYHITFAANSKLESISAYMFDGCGNLQCIIFEPGSALTSIQAHGLESMDRLSVIDFGDAKLTNIDNFAFRFCQGLYELNLPETVTNIGRYAFYGCKNLSALTIPEKVEHIGSYAFLGTHDLDVYFVGESLPVYLDENWDYGICGYYTGVTSVEQNEDYRYAVLPSGNIAILQYLGSDTAVDLTQANLGGNITIIGGSAFEGSSVESIVLPESLTAIQAEAFAYSKLKQAVIPAKLTFIGREAFAHTPIAALHFAENAQLTVIEQYAFSDTRNLTTVTLPASLTTMGTGAFQESGLQSVYFAPGILLKEIPQNAFAESKLTSVSLPDSVILVGNNAFHNVQTLKRVHFGNNAGIRLMSNAFYRTGLEQLHIPANVTYIGEYCFVGLRNLKEFTVDESNPNYKAEDGILLSRSGRKLIAVPAGRTGSLVVPVTVEEIGFGAFEESGLNEILFHADANLLSFGYRAFFQAESITTITIPASVVSIDYYAFAYCENLREVIFAEGNRLKGIYEGAFCGDLNLEHIAVPDTIVEISDFAFYGCSKITELPVSGSHNLKGIYAYAFAYTGLNGAFTVPVTVTDIGAYAFIGTKLERVTIPDTNKKNLIIGIGAFEDCNDLEEITLPFLGAGYEDDRISWFGYIFGAGGYEANNTYVPESLKKVTISEGITFIGNGGFAYCKNLEQIHLPHSISALYVETFKDTTARYTLTNTITKCADAVGYQYFNPEDYGVGIYGHLTLGEGLEIIYISDCPGLTGLTIPDGVTSVSVFECAVEELIFPDSVTDIYVPFCRNLKTVRLPATLEAISSSAFAQCHALSSVALPDGLKQIGSAAFADCYSLTEICIPDTVTEIGDLAFSGCTALGSVTLPESLTAIYSYAFSECKSLFQIINRSSLALTFGSEEFGEVAMYARWIIDRDGSKTCLVEGSDAIYVDTEDGFRFLLENGEYTLIAYLGSDETLTLPLSIQGHSYCIRNFRGGKHIILPEGMTMIGEAAFEGHSQLESIVIPDSVTEIEQGAFRNCSALESVKLPVGLTVIQYETFWRCTGLETVEIPSGVKEIQMHAFSECKALRQVTLPDSLETIDYGAFSHTAMTSLRIPAAVSNIDPSAFQDCPLETVEVDPGNRYFVQEDHILYNTDMTEIYVVPSGISHIVIPATVKDINSAFAYQRELQSVAFEQGSALREIGSMAFAGCTALESVSWPENLERIGYSAFSGCTALKHIQLPDSLLYLDDEAFLDCTELTEVMLPTGLELIGSNCFDGCLNLCAIHVDPDNAMYCGIEGIVYTADITEIVLVPQGLTGTVTVPQSVTEIQGATFSGCSKITEVILPEGITSIQPMTFQECTALKRVNIPSTVTRIEFYAFLNCSFLEEIRLPNGLTFIGERAFAGCESLNELVIPDTIAVIEGHAFLDCYGLKTVTLSQTLSEIREWVFGNCKNLRYVDIPEGVAYIDQLAFGNCHALVWVTLPQSLQEIAHQAFSNCFALCEIRNNSNLSLTFGSLDQGGVAEYAQVIVDRDGNRVQRDPDYAFALHTSEDGLVFRQENDAYTLVAYLGNAETLTLPLTFRGSAYGIAQFDGARHVIIPEGFTEISDGAFEGSSMLERITIPDTVTHIGLRAFAACSNLRSIVLPDAVTYIGSSAFEGCVNLSEIQMGENIQSIGARVFHKTAFASDPANWEADALYLDQYLLAVDEKCTEFTVRKDVLLIAYDAFENCNQLKMLQTHTYDFYVFYYCVNLETLILTRNAGELGSLLPLTLKNIVLTESFEWNSESRWLFSHISDIDIFVEAEEADLRWDENYPDWNSGNAVSYGNNWIWVSFYDTEGNLLQSTPQRTHAIVRPPHVKDEAGHSFAGWDLDGDGVADSVPATSTVDIHACALMKKTCIHSYTAEVTTAPGCVSSGLRTYTCTGCGDSYTELIPATGHERTHVENAKDATCGTDGYTGDKVCDECGATIETGATIAATGQHAYGEWVVITEPTAGEKGLRERKCADCGHVEQEEIGSVAVLLGDVNGDGRVNARDAREILRYIAGLIPDESIDRIAADFNGDGRVNARDARAILRHIAGLG